MIEISLPVAQLVVFWLAIIIPCALLIPYSDALDGTMFKRFPDDAFPMSMKFMKSAVPILIGFIAMFVAVMLIILFLCLCNLPSNSTETMTPIEKEYVTNISDVNNHICRYMVIDDDGSLVNQSKPIYDIKVDVRQGEQQYIEAVKVKQTTRYAPIFSGLIDISEHVETFETNILHVTKETSEQLS